MKTWIEFATKKTQLTESSDGMHTVTAPITYYTDWCVAEVDDTIRKYYASLVPQYYGLKPPMRSAHVTVVRKNKEKVSDWTHWGEPTTVEIRYEGVVHFNDTYFWLNCWSEDIGKLRQRLGLPVFRVGYDCYHLAIGNVKKAPISAD